MKKLLRTAANRLWSAGIYVFSAPIWVFGRLFDNESSHIPTDLAMFFFGIFFITIIFLPLTGPIGLPLLGLSWICNKLAGKEPEAETK